MTRPHFPKVRPFDDADRWLERFEKRVAVLNRCCARCRRGVVPGQFPCGKEGRCDCHV